jgi:SWI/SNF chromatin-remodeling complex subunit SWI1
VVSKLSAELIGTFWLVLGGCGSAVLAAAFPDVGIGLLGVSLAFGLTPALQFSENATPLTTVRRIFHLIASYLVDPAEAVSPLACVQVAGAPLGGTLKPPSLADLALDVFTRLGHSDGNRLAFSKAVSRPSLWLTFVSLVHRLPVLDVDFQLAGREVWLSYVEKTVMALYSLAFIFPPELKTKVKVDRSLGLKNVMMRIIQKLFVQNPNPQARQFFSVIARRVIETLKLIDDAEDSFDNTKGIVSTLSFGMGYGEVGENDVEPGTGMLGGYSDIGWDVLLCREVQEDEVMFSELESLIRVEY